MVQGIKEVHTGESILNDWEKLMLPLNVNERLIPILPFVVGGEYDAKNMQVLNFFDTIAYNAAIAKQIYDLPDGSDIEININSKV